MGKQDYSVTPGNRIRESEIVKWTRCLKPAGAVFYKKRGEKMTVRDFLIKSGIPVHLTGYSEVEMMLLESIKKPEKNFENLLKILPRDTCGRTVRYAIKMGFPNMDKKLKKQLFGNEKKVSAHRYIKTVAHAIRNNLI